MISLAQTGRRVGESAIQLHGGMGMTEELLAARLAKRVIYAGFEHGGENRHLTLAGDASFSQEHTQ
jgi:alkylation response protein AidB-like acyl-CoA dehydrogenase